MKTNAAFHIYNASAGSGKTFALVKEYCKRILTSKYEGDYSKLLAITFTNKAVTEMKSRILSTLVSFSKPEILQQPTPMLLTIASETDRTPQQLHTTAKLVVKHILHHYANFSVETIDRFNHQLLRTFARDLKLSSTFEVSLDTPLLLDEAVDRLISNAGEDEKITKVLLDFVFEKTDDDRSWDISKDISKTAKILFNENDQPHVALLKDKSLDDFIAFGTSLRKKLAHLETQISAIATGVLSQMNEEDIPFDSFPRETFPNHFKRILDGNYDVYGNKLQENLDAGGTSLYKKTIDTSISNAIDALTPFLREQYHAIKAKIFQHKLYKTVLRNLVPLSVINLVQQEIEHIKEEKNILPISEFNTLIHNEIKDQPAPFIYERLGEKYRHFFIDEFQDTSLLQWQNLIPLIDNALSQHNEDNESGSLLLVGDAKQSIYRWRGGLPEQFMQLYAKESPFAIQEVVTENLPKNYRSHATIVNFNNEFFTYVANFFGNSLHKELYIEGSQQTIEKQQDGYIQIEFTESSDREEKDKLQPEKVLEAITSARTNEFEYRDICILTRTKKDGILLNEYLLSQDIPVVSQETLLLRYSELVNCLVAVLTLSVTPENDQMRIGLLDFLHSHFQIEEPKHQFFSTFLDAGAANFNATLATHGINFELEHLSQISLYESCEYCIRQFDLAKKADAYLMGFMDFVHEFEQQPQADKISFLEEWDLKKDTMSIAASENIDAVQLMTIHKAKGLEFPVVIFPFANLKLHHEIDAKAWFELNEESFDFTEGLINFNKDVQEYGDKGAAIYTERRNTLELDTLNVLYVTLTRPVEQLYIISEKPSRITDSPNNFSQLLMSFLQSKNSWSDEQAVYTFGNKGNKQQQTISTSSEAKSLSFISSAPQAHNLVWVSKDALLWDTDASEAIDLGNVLHDNMALIETTDDLDTVLENLAAIEGLSSERISILKSMMENLIHHQDLQHLFTSNTKVMNEQGIITMSGKLLRPDRLNMHDDETITVLDYKTGTPSNAHNVQINSYASALNEMGYTVREKILVYVSEGEIVINKV